MGGHIMSIKIRKRDGHLAELDISKIQKQTSDATANLENVSQSELEVDSHIQFTDGMSSEDIQKTLINTSVTKIDIDRPNWTFVASRLFIYDLYHKVGKTLGGKKGEAYCHISDYLNYGYKEGKILVGLGENFDLEELNNYIKPERDFLFNYLGIKTLYDRYLIKDKEGNCFELPQQMFMGIAIFLAQEETDFDSKKLKKAMKEKFGSKSSEQYLKAVRTYWAKKFYDVISTHEVMLATPTLSNARTNRHQLSSCYIGASSDNIEGIFDSYKEMALLSKYGGGIGWDWNLIRAMSSSIAGHKGAAGGTVPFLKITNDIALAVDQLGCVAENTYVEVLDKVTTNHGIHDFRKEYVRYDISEKEKIEQVAAFASNFAFEYGKYSKNFISSLLYDYVMEKNLNLICSIYNLSREQYKKIIIKFKKLNKGLPTGFVILKDFKDYAISKDGIVINIHSLKPLNKIINRKGYVSVSFQKKSKVLHKLLVKTFISEDLENLTIDHIDENKLNNSLDNLNIISNEKNVSKSWLKDSSLRKEKIKLKGYLSYGKELNGIRTEKENLTELIDIKTKKILIGDLRVGDLIKSYSIEKSEVEFKEVLSTYDIIVKEKDQIKLTYSDNSYIVTSKWHPTLIKKGDTPLSYIRADETEIGDFGLNNKGNLVEIIDIDNNPLYSETYKDITVKDNNNYFASTDNKDGNFYLIHNTRKGAIAVYMEPWHKDILDFLDLKKNSGEERRRTHDLFPALWISDMFMNRVLKEEHLSLFSPENVPDLSELHGEAFEKRYLEYEADLSIPRETFLAKDIWKKALQQYFETGSPFLCFKDTANRANPNSHKGHIRSSNLCTEIFQNTSPNKYLTKIEFLDGSISTFEENELVKVDSGITKQAKTITALDSIEGKRIFIVEKEKIDGETAVCNLGSVNLSKINKKEDIERVVPILTRMLDNVINLNFYPLRKVKVTNLSTRAIGLGVMGESQMLAEKRIIWGSQEHFEEVDSIMEMISYNTIKTSSELAQEKGNYPYFKKSSWSKGILPIDVANENALKLVNRKLIYNWDELRNTVKHGMRNGYLMAIAPTSSISILVGTTQAIEPVYKRKWFEENLSGLIPVVVPNLSPETWNYYVPAYEVNQIDIIKASAIRQKWIDQGESTNIFLTLDKVNGKLLHQLYVSAWKYGLKSTYYLRSESPDAKKAEMSIADRSIECEGCQ